MSENENVEGTATVTEEPTTEAETKVPFVARIHGTGKVTLPKNIRDLLDLHEGDYVSCVAIGKLTVQRNAEEEKKEVQT